MKHTKSFLNSSTIKFFLFALTFVIGISVSALFLFKSKPAVSVPIEMTQTNENQPTENFQIENKFVVQDTQINEIVTSKIIQSEIVNFPINGRIIIESVQEIGKFPQMVFRSEKTGKILLRSSIKDEYKLLIPDKDYSGPQPEVRFTTIDSDGFKTPMIMSVGVSHGGSDNGYYLAVFSEIKGKIVRLTDDVMPNAIQGGYYLGYLNEKFGYGLAYWSFIWGDGVDESHYSPHHYSLEIYQFQNGKLNRVLKKISRKMYDSNEGHKSFLELGIKATDQRIQIFPDIAENLGL